MTITSPHNDQLKEIRKLAGRKWRDKLREFVAEGEDLIAAAEAAGWEPIAKLVAEGSGLEGEEVAPHLLAQVSQLGSGTRAMDHGIEAICSSRPNVLVNAVCLQGLHYLYAGLRRTKDNPNDEAARLNCQLGSWMSAFGLQSRVPMGASHAIGHVLGGTCDVPHYFCTAVMMPSVLRYNRPATEAAQTLVAAALGAPQRDASDAFATFIAELGLPRRLADVGVAEDRFELIGKNAMLSIFTRANPQPIREPADVVKILKLAA